MVSESGTVNTCLGTRGRGDSIDRVSTFQREEFHVCRTDVIITGREWYAKSAEKREWFEPSEVSVEETSIVRRP